jgi:hypothetical protein
VTRAIRMKAKIHHFAHPDCVVDGLDSLEDGY